MPPPVPPRYRLEVRLGRDHDIEEWLATDTDLDRPVLIRVLGADASQNRQERFLRMVRQAARVSHNHVAAIYSAALADGSAYAVTEWVGGVTLANRIEAGETPPIAEFLSNAAGLSDGLSALHEEGVVHGGIDPSAIFYASAHPAKLGGFGRRGALWSTGDDVQSLGAALGNRAHGTPSRRSSSLTDDRRPAAGGRRFTTPRPIRPHQCPRAGRHDPLDSLLRTAGTDEDLVMAVADSYGRARHHRRRVRVAGGVPRRRSCIADPLSRHPQSFNHPGDPDDVDADRRRSAG